MTELLNAKLFIVVPLLSMLCNIFLFLTCLSAKKDKVINSFLHLLAIFIAWTAGSLFMRMGMLPGADFWYEVSITAIFLVPFFLYNFVDRFCSANRVFTRISLLIAWVIVAALNLMHVFIKNPRVTMVHGHPFFDFQASWWSVIPIVLAVLTLVLAFRICSHSIKKELIPLDHFLPLFIGVCIMFLGVTISVLPSMVSLPTDTFACGINAIFLYYALYRKRIITLTQMASNSSSYLLAAIFTTCILLSAYSGVDYFFTALFPDYLAYKTIVIAVAFSLLTSLVYTITRKLMNSLFVKRQEVQDAHLKDFSNHISRTLDTTEILTVYREFLSDNSTSRLAYILLYQPKTELYEVSACTQTLRDRSFSLSRQHPLVQWLAGNDRGIYYRDFQKTRLYKSMWEEEKRAITALKVDFILPLKCDDTLAGITMFSAPDKSDSFPVSEITLLESAAAILSIALKNASLYTDMQNKARQDSLTGLWNRGYFHERIREAFELSKHDCATLILFSLDDFRLYNELYGSLEGDTALGAFADALRAHIGSRGIIARYGGKEFAVFYPMGSAHTACDDAAAIRNWIAVSAPSAGTRVLTVSAGVCAYPSSASTLDELITYANMAVYSAKKSGKNRIVTYSPMLAQPDRNAAFYDKHQLGENSLPTIYALTAAIDAKDHYTFSHSSNVATYAAVLAESIPLDAEHVEIIRQAGLLHDIGKIGIPEAILTKAAPLTPEEYAIMKEHVQLSISMIRYLPSLTYVIPSAIGHHERWDGMGYPRHLAGESIPIGARCLCLADSFDAMTSHRAYRDAMSVEQALDEIRRNLGTQFDPKLGQLFIHLVEQGKILPNAPPPEQGRGSNAPVPAASAGDGIIPPEYAMR